MRLLLVLLSLIALPAAAQACESSLNAAAAEVEIGAGLSPSTLRQVRSSCGEGGPASLVAVLVQRGSCDHAAQLARSLPGSSAMEGALTAADACLTGQLQSSLDALADAADEAEAAGEDAEWGRADLDAPAPAARPQARPRPDASAEAMSGGLLGNLGSIGSASGTGGLGTRGYGRDGGSRSRRAATGIGSWEPGPARRSEIGVPSGATVAWTRLSFGIWFDYDSSALRSAGLGTVGTLARTLRDMDEGTVLEVVGHTDSTGSWYYNEALSRQRAEAVRQALMLAGIPASKLSIHGAGEDQPVAENYSPSGRARNRRVEFRFYKPVAARPVTR